MTLEEAIKHCLEVAEQNETQADKIGRQFIGNAMDKRATDCRECAADHRQLAKWLKELKEARRLLKWAVEGYRKLGASLNDDGECDGDCLYCPINNHGNCLKWEHEDEALALIGEDANVGHKSGGWISCEERMPEVNEPVLFVFNTGSGFKAVMYGWHETIKGLGSGWHQAGVGGARADEEVTHWQPLPEPPKE